MQSSDLFRTLDIGGSGLHAERLRMQIITANIANAQVTRMDDGTGPYRRKEVVFAQELSRALMLRAAKGEGGVAGVKVAGVSQDPTQGKLVYRPGHPDADENNMVRMPNVEIASEMVDLLMASRAYEANLNSIKAFQEMMRQTLGIGKG